MDAKGLEALGAVLKEFSVSHDRKVSDGNYGSVGAFFSLTLQVAPGVDLDALATAAEIYCKQRVDARFVNEKPAFDGALKKNADALFPPPPGPGESYAELHASQAIASVEPVSVPDGDGVQEVTEFAVAKYTIAVRPDGKHELRLFPRIKDEPGKYAEVTFVADEGDTAKMIAEVAQDVPKVPSQGLVAWRGFYKLGREYVSKKDGKTRQYRDLVAIRLA